MPIVLLVEDDPHLRYGIRFNLEKEGYRVSEHGSAESASEALQAGERPDLALLDIMLPGRSGLELLENLRSRGHHFPVLMLTARSDESDAVTALSLGADDYVRKPFGLSELLARIAAVRRRLEAVAPAATPLRLGRWRLDLAGFRARSDAGEIALTSLEAELLGVLLERPGEVCRRELLLERVWGVGTGVLTRTLDNHVARLRKKLELDPSHPSLVITVHGVGYKALP